MTIVRYSIKSQFFDRAEVLNRVSKTEAKALRKMGAIIRRKARQLIGQPAKRKTTKPRPPGQPPRARSSDEVRTLRNILFGYEPDRHTVVVGPVGFSRRARTVPEMHEFGRGIPERPFMNPALKKTLSNIPNAITTSIS